MRRAPVGWLHPGRVVCSFPAKGVELHNNSTFSPSFRELFHHPYQVKAHIFLVYPFYEPLPFGSRCMAGGELRTGNKERTSPMVGRKKFAIPRPILSFFNENRHTPLRLVTKKDFRPVGAQKSLVTNEGMPVLWHGKGMSPRWRQ